jgi:2-keto-4-pentenoate hydratase/2-oxohepta-3-ene-1,7-dioic acid hydratase in catechol pathway
MSKSLSKKDAYEKASIDVPSCMIRFIEMGEEALTNAREIQDFAIKSNDIGTFTNLLIDVQLEAPVPKPPLIVNMGNAYRPMIIDSFTLKPQTGVIGPGEPVVIPREISDFGAVFECEIGLVVGKKGRRVLNDDEAYDYVYGYTIYNDVTDYGRQIKNIFDMKIFDTFCPMGPCITTKDEIQDPYNLTKKAFVNGQLATQRNTKEMLHKIPEFISVPSRTLTLQPGTIISTGAANAGRIRPGDMLELEIAGIGRMRNPVIGEQ